MVDVVTVVLNGTPDPQRGSTLPADPGLVSTLAATVNHLTVLTDCIPPGDHHGAHWVRVPPGGNPYFYRWQLIADHITGDGQVWCVDATDVEMLTEPPAVDRLHIGSEPSTVGSSWMRATNPSLSVWIAGNAHRPLLNPGIVGGPAEHVRAFARRVGMHPGWRRDMTDMGAANKVAYEQFPDHVTGHPVHTPYKADQRTTAWWKHK